MRLAGELNAMAASTSSLASRVEKQFNPGYADSLDDDQSKARYADKLGAYLSGIDPYEEVHWNDDVEFWPAVTSLHVCMYLILYPSPYTNEEMLNYKSLDSFRNFQNGWVREVLVKEVGNKRLVIGKVSQPVYTCKLLLYMCTIRTYNK